MLLFNDNMNEITQELREVIGLNEREAKIYLALLGDKAVSASILAKITKVNRTTVYLELERLIDRGLVSYVIQEGKRFFSPSLPEKLVEILETKKSRIESILPQLKVLSASLAIPFPLSRNNPDLSRLLQLSYPHSL